MLTSYFTRHPAVVVAESRSDQATKQSRFWLNVIVTDGHVDFCDLRESYRTILHAVDPSAICTLFCVLDWEENNREDVWDLLRQAVIEPYPTSPIVCVPRQLFLLGLPVQGEDYSRPPE